MGRPPALGFRAKRHHRVIQPLAGAIQRHDLGLGRNLNAIAALHPIGDRPQQPRMAFIDRIVPKPARMIGNHIRHPARKGMFRLTDGHMHHLAAGRMGVQQAPQARKRIGR